MKKIITIIIVVAALAGAGFLGYSALYKNSSPAGGSKSANTATTILPYGTDMNFKPIQDFNNTNRFFPYPKVTPPEIGATTTALVP